MLRCLALCIVWMGAPAASYGLELIANGDFEQGFPPAWETEFVGSAASALRSPAFDGDPDFEAMAQKGTGNGYARLHQVVPIPSLDLDFSAHLKCEATASAGGPWAVGALLLQYEDAFANVLGTTAIGQKSPLCPWADSGTFHWIPVADQGWHAYGFHVADELVNLYDVDPAAVCRIRIVATGVVGGDC